MNYNQFRIFHVTSVHRPDDTRIFLKECQSLRDEGFSVNLVYLGSENKEEVIDGVNLICLKRKYTGRLGRILFDSRKLFSEVAKRKPNLVHFHDPELLFHTNFFRSESFTIVFDAHEDLPLQILGKHYIPFYLRKPLAALVKSIERHFCRKIDAVVGATPSISGKFSRYGILTALVRNFPMLKEFSSAKFESAQNRPNDLCYIGGIMESRGIIQLLDAMTFLPYRLHLCGSYFPDSLRERLIRHPAWHKVIEHGFVGRVEIQDVLSKSRIGVVTLLPQENYIESLPIKMFEYMAAGLPVVASNFHLWKQVIEESQCGICVDPNQPEEIANAISKIMSDDALALKMGINGKYAVENSFNWKNESKSLIDFYEYLLVRKNKP